MTTVPPAKSRVLIVDDDRAIRDSMQVFLRREGFETTAAASVSAALAALRSNRIDVMITDVNLDDGDGFELLRSVRAHWPDTTIIVVTGFGSVQSAVEAMKLGAFEYLTKPIVDDEIRLLVDRALQHQSVVRENRDLKQRLSERYSLDNIIGRSYQMQRVYDLIEAVADSRATVLMHGETGTGKSLIARAIHQHSGRREKPFVEVACGAIPETLLESELFGHVRGAFTGAVNNKAGKFEAAEGGTILLDEISTASPSLQVKLLRVLQDKQFERLGSNQTLRADVRIILATNVDLQREVREGRFREDLYYRVNVVTIHLPPLRERISDIRLLCDHFLAHYAAQAGKPIAGFDHEAVSIMQRYAWPGNVRELENCIERAVVLTRDGRLTREDLPPALLASAHSELDPGQGGWNNKTLKAALAEPEKRIIEAALEANDWNRQETARKLDINRTTLYKKMRRYGLVDPRRRRH
jgi:DNA-binding NtrC family response regulator